MVVNKEDKMEELITKAECSKCNRKYEVTLEEVPREDNFVLDICPFCDDDGWKELERR